MVFRVVVALYIGIITVVQLRDMGVFVTRYVTPHNINSIKDPTLCVQAC